MKQFFFAIALIIPFFTNAQTKHVLLEEFTGAHCGNCPMGAYYADSMLTKYPNLIAVALHNYPTPDAMDFAEIDTIFDAYGTGSPLACVDRINPGGVSTNVAQYITAWDGNIQTQLAQTALVGVAINSNWNSVTRNISAQIDLDILANLPAGDYRINLYVVEDSVTGSGAGYDQSNIYNTMSGSQFYGLGDPIIGYVHRHVVRAILPQAWGQAGVIPTSPTNGQSFSSILNYTLPISYDENQIKLVAFVTRIVSNHETDEVLNAAEADLGFASSISENISATEFSMQPNPFNTSTLLKFNVAPIDADLTVYDLTGRVVRTIQNITGNNFDFERNGLPSGIYILQLRKDGLLISSGKMSVVD